MVKTPSIQAGAIWATIGREAGTLRTGHQPDAGLTETQTTINTPHSHLQLDVCGLWEKAGVPREKPRKQGENIETPGYG